MRSYTQFNLNERMTLAEMKQNGCSLAVIAEAVGKNKSSISRELRRNVSGSHYWPDTAHNMARSRKGKTARIESHPGLEAYIINQLCGHYWTPEQISASLRHHKNWRGTEHLPYVSHETIYTWIYRKPQKTNKLWKFLPRHKAKRGLRKSKRAGVGIIPNRVSIHQRPACVAEGKAFGHWEGDLMSFQKNSQHMVVVRERKTMMTLSVRLKNKRADTTTKQVMRLMKKIPQNGRHTITLDNGGEFAGHEAWQKTLGLVAYFCDPYASWQKGGVENTNGRLRRDLPRKTNIHDLSQEDFDEILINYNHTPRKKLGWLTPYEAFINEINPVALQT